MGTHAVKSIEESVEEVGGGQILQSVDVVVDLVQGHSLRIDERGAARV